MDVAIGLVIFNPSKSKRILMNYLYTVNHLQNLPVYTLELAFEDRVHEIPASKTVFHVRSNSYMFHKERMCRVLETRIPKKFKKIVFMDADLFFSTPEWYSQMSKKLDDFEVVQGFEVAHWLDLSYKYINRTRYTTYFNKTNVYTHIYHPGFIWGFQRKWYNKVGFYDYGISGSADVLSCCQFLRYTNGLDDSARPEGLRKTFLEYFNLPAPTVSYLEKVRIFHLYHGSVVNRNYCLRHEIFKNENDIPSLLYLNNDGIYEWKDKKWNYEYIKYFNNRDDNSVDILPNNLIIDRFVENAEFLELGIKSAYWGDGIKYTDVTKYLRDRITTDNIYLASNLFQDHYMDNMFLRIDYEDGRIQIVQPCETFSLMKPQKNLWNFIEKVVFINLDKRKDRLARMKYITQSFGDKAIRFEAIEMSRGEVGATMSHIEVLKFALESGWKNVLILEDDVEWNKFDSGYEMLEKFANEPYDVIMLGASQIQHDNHKVISAKTAASYLVNGHYIPKLLANMKEGLEKLIRSKIPYLDDKENPLDQYWNTLQIEDNWRIVSPSLLYQVQDYSDIEKKIIDHRHWSNL